MKKWMIPLISLGITFSFGSCINSENPIKKEYKEIKNLAKIVWDADTLIKNSNKSVYQAFLPDSIINKSENNTDKIDLNFNNLNNEYLNLKLQRLKHYNNFRNTQNYEEGLKAIAYSQYLASKFPGTDGSELEKSAQIIDEISRKLR